MSDFNGETIVVTGGRDFADKALVWKVLDDYCAAMGGHVFLFHGCCPTGADKHAAQWAFETRKGTVVPFHAEWKRHGPAAGPIRNLEMIHGAAERAQRGCRVKVIAFPGGRGTRNCWNYAKAAGLARVKITPTAEGYNEKGWPQTLAVKAPEAA